MEDFMCPAAPQANRHGCSFHCYFAAAFSQNIRFPRKFTSEANFGTANFSHAVQIAHTLCKFLDTVCKFLDTVGQIRRFKVSTVIGACCFIMVMLTNEYTFWTVRVIRTVS